MKRLRSILLVGPPGAGKGMVGRALGAIPGFFFVSCGDVFRSLDPGSELGRAFAAFAAEGRLVPDDITVRLWRQHLHNLGIMGALRPDEHHIVLDGIPRSVAQARLMEPDADVALVFHLDCADRALLAGRLRGHGDDAIRRRFATFDGQTRPVLDHFRDRTVAIDAARKPCSVLKDVLAACAQRLAGGA